MRRRAISADLVVARVDGYGNRLDEQCLWLQPRNRRIVRQHGLAGPVFDHRTLRLWHQVRRHRSRQLAEAFQVGRQKTVYAVRLEMTFAMVLWQTKICPDIAGVLA